MTRHLALPKKLVNKFNWILLDVAISIINTAKMVKSRTISQITCGTSILGQRQIVWRIFLSGLHVEGLGAKS